ncbi:cardiolipin synthase B [Alcanivorax sp. JB21]|uniref:phospholipase D-like domain-containing protein n=1 Tax=Alcanivorax limicola TaxID=2874102 RepID=UPI001CBBEEA3|nr:phospholipase D-like domain-containing protein [Alcanivorax limicola]MBZ2190417.1 cardiolipin synthase B [Alcanivorax limicola]
MKKSIGVPLVIAAGLALLFLLGNLLVFNALPKSKRLLEPLAPTYSVADPAFRQTLDALLHSPVRGGHDIQPLEGGEEIYAAMREAVRQAQHSVTFETYEFWGPASAGVFADVLAEAAERGVKVKVLVDYIGSRAADPEKFTRMNEAGVSVVRWREPSWYQLSRFNHRTHRKLLMIDGEIGFIGGANMADNWLASEGDNSYRDHHFRIQGPVVANMQGAFAETWLEATGELLEGELFFPALSEQGDAVLQLVKSSPREGRHRMRALFMYAIASAETSITASTAYFYPDPAFLEALTAAAERGVRIRILVPGGSIDQGYIRHASVNRWQPMLEAGVALYEYQPSMYHAKLLTIDDAWASVGSSNMDNRSFRINDEANLNIYDEDTAWHIRMLIENDMKSAQRYTLSRWEQRPWYKRLVGHGAALLGAHL